MSRIRTVKPSFWADEDLSNLPECVHMLACSLLNYSDDEGYFNANEGLIKASCFPLRDPSVSTHGMLTELSNIGYIELFAGLNNKQYGKVVKFLEHQRVNRPTPSHIKGLIEFTEDSVSTHGTLTEPSSPEGKGREGKGKENPFVENPPNPKNVDLDDQEVLFTSEIDGEAVDLVETAISDKTNDKVVGILEKPGSEAHNPKPANPIEMIFEFWKTELNHSKSKFGDDRKSQINKALKTYTFDECISAIRGCKKSPHHMGDNDRNTVYDSLELIFRNSTFTDKFIALDCDPNSPQNSPRNSPTNANHEDIFEGAI